MNQLPTLTMFQRTTRFGLYLFAGTIAISQVPAQLGAAIALLGWLSEGVVNRNWQARWHLFFVPYLFYIGWNFFASMLSPRIGHSLWAIADNEWEVVVMLMMFWTIAESTSARRLLLLFLGSATIAMVYSLWQVFSGVELYRHAALTPAGGQLYRAVGFYALSLTFAAFAMIAFCFSTTYVICQPAQERRRWSAVAVLSLLAVIGTFARGIWLALIVIALLLGLLLGSKRTNRRLALILPLLLLALLAIPDVRMRAVETLDLSHSQTRLNLWHTALRMGSAHPVFGVGQDNWDYYFEEFKVPGYYDTTAHPHNDFLNVLICSGVPGLLAFVAMWGIALRMGMRDARKAAGPLARSLLLGGTLALAGLLTGALTQNYYGTFLNTWHWWFAVGFLFVGHRLVEETQISS